MSQFGSALSELAARARAAMTAGRPAEAAQLWSQLLALAPDHPQALFHSGQLALHLGDTAKARMLLERAANLSPKDPLPPLNLAIAARRLKDEAAEAAALDRALAADPYCYPALLLKGAMLDRGNQPRQAARIYKDALAILPPDDTLSPDLREQAVRARELVAKNAAEMQAALEAELAPLRAQHAGALDRFDQCRDVATGAKKIYTQQPTVLHYPGLPAIQFYDKADFPWLKALEAKTDVIRDEFLKLYHEDAAGFAPYVDHPPGTPVNQWAELNHNPRWSAAHLWRDGKRDDAVCARVPETAKAVEAVPKVTIPNFGPTVLFSALAPKTRIPAHTSSTNVRLIVHLPLIVPPSCGFRVGNETREWKVGEAWVFDDTIEHEAWNDSDQLRVILMIDIWNPHLSEAERALVSALLNGIRKYNA
ncbi:MAG: aspartyl/asparaginyl beta-hydroxylase domain-containing protein [Alphaproteobacteria bacterium]|nr:aspartyl/asparaginyl beta-hydroxylase domain-containing protein [Alphaproteobacteria bacterium]